MLKFLYPIYKLKIDNYKKWWLYHKKAGGGGILSDIVEGFSLTLQNSLARKFTKFDIEGHSEQETTEGYNLLDWTDSGTSTANGVTRNFETPTKIKFSGTPTGAQVRVYGVPLPTLEANTDYTLVCNGISGSNLYYNLGYIGDSTLNVKVFNSGTNLSRYLEIHAQSTSAVNVTIEFMLLKGSYTASNVPSYEPYTGRNSLTKSNLRTTNKECRR